MSAALTSGLLLTALLLSVCLLALTVTARRRRAAPGSAPTGRGVRGFPPGFTLPLPGALLPLSEVPDPVFSGGLVGQGFAILPECGEVRAPLSGEVVTLFPTLHAVGLRADSGLEVLIHVGIDTVNLMGQGFTALVVPGERVQAGQLLLRFDLGELRGRVPSLASPVLFPNLPEGTRVDVGAGGVWMAGSGSVEDGS